MSKNDTPQLLRAIRNKLNLSQEQLAAKLNVAFATVNRWESGKSAPQKAQAQAIQDLIDEAGLGDAPRSDEPAGSGRRRRGVQKSSVLGTKSMEQMLWDAACSIRGEKDAPKFKDYLLPLLFVKRLSDVFDDEIARLADQFGDKETALEVLEADHSLVRFYIPAEARWAVVSGRQSFSWPTDRQPKTLGEQLTTTIRAIVKHNPTLAGVIDTVDFNETRNGEREISDAALKGIIEIFSDSRYRLGLHDVEPDFLGRCYEYLLRKFAEGQGQSAGEFFTPTEVGFLMAEVMRPRPGEQCYDYACGSFGLLIKLQLVCRRLDPLSKVPLKLYGQEFTGSSYAIACMNKIIHDMDGEVVRGDSMRNPKFKDADNRLKRFDVVVANPMWNQPFDSDVYDNDAFDRFEKHGGITTSKADWAWLQHTVASLKDGGRAAVVLDTGAVTRGSGSKNEDKERNIRKWFVEHDLIEGVILLPDNLFYNTPAAGIIVVLRKNKPKDRRGKIVLINASKEFKKGAPKNYLTPEAIAKIASAFAKGESVEGFCAVISNEQAAESDFNLSAGRYVKSADQRESIGLPTLMTQLQELDETDRKISEELTPLLTFTHGLRSEPQKETEIGLLPERWQLCRIGELFSITQGISLKGNLADGADGIPFLRTSNVYWGRIDLSTVSRMHIDPLTVGDRWLADGDLLVCEGGEIGRAAVWEGEGDRYTYQNHLHRLRPKEASVIDPKFAMAWLEVAFCQRSVYEGAGNKTTIPNLSRSRLSELLMPLPPIDEQRDIVQVLDAISRKIAIHDRTRTTLQDLFETLLHMVMNEGLRAPAAQR